MFNEENYIYHYNEFEPIQDFEKIFGKSDDALLGFDVLNNKIYLKEIVHFKIFCEFIYLFKCKAIWSSNC